MFFMPQYKNEPGLWLACSSLTKAGAAETGTAALIYFLANLSRGCRWSIGELVAMLGGCCLRYGARADNSGTCASGYQSATAPPRKRRARSRKYHRGSTPQ